MPSSKIFNYYNHILLKQQKFTYRFYTINNINSYKIKFIDDNIKYVRT